MSEHQVIACLKWSELFGHTMEAHVSEIQCMQGIQASINPDHPELTAMGVEHRILGDR